VAKPVSGGVDREGLAIQGYAWSWSKGFGPKYNLDTQRYMFNKAVVYYHSLYTLSATTVRSRKKIGMIQPMTDLKAAGKVSSSPDATLGDVQIAGTVGVIGAILVGTAVVVSGYRNRTRY
jgi:hypothetical protein